LADGAGAAVTAVVEPVPPFVGFDEFCAVEEFSDAECAIAAFVVVVTGSAAELTSVCTLVKLPEGAGKTTALASESSFCRASESLAGVGVEVRGAAVPVEVGAIFLVELEKRFGEIASVAGWAAARIVGSREARGALGLIGTDVDGFVLEVGTGGWGGAEEFAVIAIETGVGVRVDGCEFGIGEYAAAIRVVPGKPAGEVMGNVECVEEVEIG